MAILQPDPPGMVPIDIDFPEGDNNSSAINSGESDASSDISSEEEDKKTENDQGFHIVLILTCGITLSFVMIPVSYVSVKRLISSCRKCRRLAEDFDTLSENAVGGVCLQYQALRQLEAAEDDANQPSGMANENINPDLAIEDDVPPSKSVTPSSSTPPPAPPTTPSTTPSPIEEPIFNIDEDDDDLGSVNASDEDQERNKREVDDGFQSVPLYPIDFENLSAFSPNVSVERFPTDSGGSVMKITVTDPSSQREKRFWFRTE